MAKVVNLWVSQASVVKHQDSKIKELASFKITAKLVVMVELTNRLLLTRLCRDQHQTILFQALPSQLVALVDDCSIRM